MHEFRNHLQVSFTTHDAMERWEPHNDPSRNNGLNSRQEREFGRGMAALGICESLLLALTDLKIISERDARDLLTDVATTHKPQIRERQRSIRR